MKTTTTIKLNEEKMNILLSWIFGEFKPTEWHNTDKKIVKQLKKACERLSCEELFEEWSGIENKEVNEFGEEILPEEKKEIEDINGIFFCPKCKVRTNKKTYETKCVLCGTSLYRR